MPAPEGGATKERKGKKPHKNKPTSKKYAKYKEGKKEGKTCPRCGPGIFLAVHKDRLHCGKCNYTEFVKK
ncbi:MAG: 30S ribosomal protein S27ae [Candidatus Pacearchaeota archaeon]